MNMNNTSKSESNICVALLNRIIQSSESLSFVQNLDKHIPFVLHGTVPLTLPETNITPENRRLEDHLPFGKAYFSGAILVQFQGGFLFFWKGIPCTNGGGRERTSARSHRNFLRPGRRTASAVFWNARKTHGEETNRRAVVALQGKLQGFGCFFCWDIER